MRGQSYIFKKLRSSRRRQMISSHSNLKRFIKKRRLIARLFLGWQKMRSSVKRRIPGLIGANWFWKRFVILMGGQPYMKRRYYGMVGRLQMVLADYEAAIDNFEKASRLEPIDKGFAPFRIKLAYYHAECYRLTGNYLEAIRKSDEIRIAGEKFNSKFAIMLADWRALLIYKLLDDVPKALEICNHLKESGDDKANDEAAAFGVSSPRIRTANLRRQEAELRRYIGDYVGSGVALRFLFFCLFD